jgi:hypothetical protein
VLARLRIEPLERDHDGLALGEALGGGGVDQRAGLRLDLLGADAAREQLAHLAHREQRAGLGEHARAERLGGRRVGADHDQQAAGRVAERLGGREHAAANADVGRARRPLGLAGPARALGRPPATFVLADLDAARG